MKIFWSFVLLLTCIGSGATDIYRNGASLVTGTWQSGGVLEETAADQPFDGTEHLRFAYSYTENWSGFGLNMDNWGSGNAVDFSGYTHLHIAFRGVSPGQNIEVTLRSGDHFGQGYVLGGDAVQYTTIEIPLIFLLGSLDPGAITELMFSVSGPDPVGSGAVYIDAIYLLDGSGEPVGSDLWPLQRAMGRGFNLTNWLEAYWLMPFGAYPETDKFTREHFEFMAAGGMKTVRMPVTFERLAGDAPGYLLDTAHVAFALVDSVISWTRDLGLYLIIDNHHGYELSDATYEEDAERLGRIWEQLIDRYGYLNPDSVLFELHNEATFVSNARLRDIFEYVVSVIRTRTAEHAVIIGANYWNSGSGLTSFEPLNDRRIIYTFHNYDPYEFTHQGMSWTQPPYFPARTFPQGDEAGQIRDLFRSVRAWSDIFDVPVFLGEYGAAVSADAESRCNYIVLLAQLADSLEFPHIYWDVFQPSDGFGFVEGGVLSPDAVAPCFAAALGLDWQSSHTGESLDGTVALHLWPNPADGYIFIQADRPGAQAAERSMLEIFNSAGTMVWSRSLGSGQHYRASVSLELMPPGIYTARYSDGRSVVVQKFIRR